MAVAGVCKDHVVDFYWQDDRLIERVSAYLAAGLRQGDAAVVVATEAHRNSIEAALVSAGVDLDAARRSGTWTALDAANTLEGIGRGDRLSAEGFSGLLSPVLSAATEGGRRACVYGEMVQLLWEEGDVSSAVSLESLWNDLGRRLDFSLYCAYRAAHDDGRREALEAICQLHSEVAHRHGWPERQAELSFDADPLSPGDARRFMRKVLDDWGMAEAAEAAELVLTELTTNALLHARTGFTVVLTDSASSLRICVHDANRDLPCRYGADLESFSGRGLALIEALSLQWGCAVRSDGKEVWADVSVGLET